MYRCVCVCVFFDVFIPEFFFDILTESYTVLYYYFLIYKIGSVIIRYSLNYKYFDKFESVFF